MNLNPLIKVWCLSRIALPWCKVWVLTQRNFKGFPGMLKVRSALYSSFTIWWFSLIHLHIHSLYTTNTKICLLATNYCDDSNHVCSQVQISSLTDCVCHALPLLMINVVSSSSHKGNSPMIQLSACIMQSPILPSPLTPPPPPLPLALPLTLTLNQACNWRTQSIMTVTSPNRPLSLSRLSTPSP